MHNLTRRQFLRAGGSAVMGVGLAGVASGCSPSSWSSASAEAQGLQELTLVLDYTPNTNHIGIFVALAKGYYEDERITLSVQQPPEDGADALVGFGNAEFGISFQDWMANYLGSNTPLPITAIAAIIQHNTSGIMSRKASDITSPQKIQGMRYGTLDNACEQAVVKSMMIHAGVSDPELIMVSAQTTDEVTSLKADLFDCIEVFAGWGLQNAYVQDFPVNFFMIRDEDPIFDFYTPVIIANNDFLAQNPDTVRAFLRATAKGYCDATNNLDEAYELLVEQVPELEGELTKRSSAYLATEFMDGTDTWGLFDAERWNRFYTWMNEQQLTRAPLEMNKGFTNDYL